MRKAAERLNITQPSISRAIIELEGALGVPLLDRTPQGVEPTEYGRALLQAGTAMFDDLRQGVKNIEFLADPTAGEVRIGCASFAASFVIAVIDQFSRRYPRIVFHLKAGLVEELHRELLDRNVDLVISRKLGPLADGRTDFEFLFDGSLVVAAGAQSRWARRRKVTLSELMNEPWALPSSISLIGSFHLEAFRASGLDYPRATVVVHPENVRIGLLATGRFLTMCDPSVLNFHINRREIVALPIKLPVASAPLGILDAK